MFTLAVSSLGHDASTTLLENNKVVYFSPSDRTTRKKYDSNVCYDSLSYLSKYTKHIDNLVLVTSSHQRDNEIRSSLLSNKFTIGRIWTSLDTKFMHHVFHAAAGFYQSGFQDSSALIVDAFGSGVLLNEAPRLRGSETTSIYNISYPNNFVCLYKKITAGAAARSNNKPITFDIPLTEKKVQEYITKIKSRFNCEIELSLSDIGLLYNAGTLAVGFREPESGKLMGLAGYGKPNTTLNFIEKGDISSHIWQSRNGLGLNQKLFLNDEIVNKSRFSQSFRKDIAYAIQNAFEYLYIDKVKKALDISKHTRLVVSGGCSLNILVNSLIVKQFPSIQLYVDPIASDSTISMGAAFYYYYDVTKSNERAVVDNLYLGQEYKYTIDDVKKLLI